jgi:hypothetical protein
MKRILTAIAILVSTVSFAQTKQQRNVSGFTGISVATGIEAELTQGSEDAVSVSVSDDKLLEGLKTEVVNGVLKIYYDNKMKNNNFGKHRKLQVFVTYKSINKLSGSSGASIKATNTINGAALAFDMSSGAQFNGDIKTTDLTIDQSSGAISKVSGNATSVKADISSGSIFTGSDLTSDNCKVSASSGAVLKIGVSTKLTARASSGGVVNYKGSPEVDKSVSSGGVVSKI